MNGACRGLGSELVAKVWWCLGGVQSVQVVVIDLVMDLTLELTMELVMELVMKPVVELVVKLVVELVELARLCLGTRMGGCDQEGAWTGPSDLLRRTLSWPPLAALHSDARAWSALPCEPVRSPDM